MFIRARNTQAFSSCVRLRRSIHQQKERNETTMAPELWRKTMGPVRRRATSQPFSCHLLPLAISAYGERNNLKTRRGSSQHWRRPTPTSIEVPRTRRGGRFLVRREAASIWRLTSPCCLKPSAVVSHQISTWPPGSRNYDPNRSDGSGEPGGGGHSRREARG